MHLLSNYIIALSILLHFYRHTTDLLLDSMLLVPSTLYLPRPPPRSARSQPRRGKGTTVFLMNPYRSDLLVARGRGGGCLARHLYA